MSRNRAFRILFEASNQQAARHSSNVLEHGTVDAVEWYPSAETTMTQTWKGDIYDSCKWSSDRKYDTLGHGNEWILVQGKRGKKSRDEDIPRLGTTMKTRE